jgi:hypothetical protein
MAPLGVPERHIEITCGHSRGTRDFLIRACLLGRRRVERAELARNDGAQPIAQL